jgi:hypothetical protein
LDENELPTTKSELRIKSPSLISGLQILKRVKVSTSPCPCPRKPFGEGFYCQNALIWLKKLEKFTAAPFVYEQSAALFKNLEHRKMRNAKDLKTIMTDCPRTYSGNHFFASKEGQNKLCTVLARLSQHPASVGYL